MIDDTTSLRRCDGAGEQSQGMSAMCSGAIAGEVPVALLSVVAGRCLAALRRLTAERVQRCCGGFSADDVTWQAGLWECGEAMDELCDAGWVRFTGFDDEQCEVPCYALVEPEVVGMGAGETRYGKEQLVALEVVGVPVKREAGDEWQWTSDRAMLLSRKAKEVRAGGQWTLSWKVRDRAERVHRGAEEMWRRMSERWAMSDLTSARFCTSLVVVGEGRGA